MFLALVQLLVLPFPMLAIQSGKVAFQVRGAPLASSESDLTAADFSTADDSDEEFTADEAGDSDQELIDKHKIAFKNMRRHQDNLLSASSEENLIDIKPTRPKRKASTRSTTKNSVRTGDSESPVATDEPVSPPGDKSIPTRTRDDKKSWWGSKKALILIPVAALGIVGLCGIIVAVIYWTIAT